MAVDDELDDEADVVDDGVEALDGVDEVDVLEEVLEPDDVVDRAVLLVSPEPEPLQPASRRSWRSRASRSCRSPSP